MRILIAEDDPFISRMYQIKLEAGGFRVIVKNNGRDAFEGGVIDQAAGEHALRHHLDAGAA